jgi:hypothetical protein
MATSKNVIPAKAGIHKFLTLLDSRLRRSDKFGVIRGSLMIRNLHFSIFIFYFVL